MTASEREAGRCGMRAIITVTALSIALAIFGCVDNDVTFFVEHVKVQPEAPQCSTSAGDDFAPSGLIDLAVANSFFNYYYVTNAAMLREDYDNIRAETDGIMVEGMEVYVQSATAGGGLVGGSEYFDFAHYIPPETSEILAAISIPQSVIVEMADAAGCRRIDTYNDPAEIAALAIQSPLMWPPPWEADTGTVYSTVRFLGHTQGGKEVETEEFSFMVKTCCNCLVDWSPCIDLCGTFCESGEDVAVCSIGVANSAGTEVDCRHLSYDRTFVWQSVDASGNTITMTCDDCTEPSS
jgi:hypothetical protein